MGTGAWSDLRALLRAMRLGRATPQVIAMAKRKTAEYEDAFEHTVLPILNHSVADAERRAQMAASMLSYSTKSAFVVDGYARMTGVSFASDIAMLGMSFTRLYDDLLDEGGDPGFGRRVGELFTSGTFTPASEQELVLLRLYRELDRRLGRDRTDPYYAATLAVHEYQVRSACQRDPRTSRTTLEDIARGKGGHGTLTIFALMRPALSPGERRLIMEIGEALQMLDDYADVLEDRRNGIRTAATEGRLHLADIARHLRAARPKLAAHYGPRAARPFLAVCYLIMWICFLTRHRFRPGSGRPGAAEAGQPHTSRATAAPSG